MIRPSMVATYISAMLAFAAPRLASAAVQNQAANGFTVSETAEIAAPPERVYEALLAPAHWWNSAHTYSQNSANLTLEPRAGGCWCETLRGALGPLQGMAVDGAMTFGLRGAGNATELTLTYAVGGYAKDGFAELAGAVDSVLAEQSTRLKRFVETGSAETAAGPANKGE